MLGSAPQPSHPRSWDTPVSQHGTPTPSRLQPPRGSAPTATAPVAVLARPSSSLTNHGPGPGSAAARPSRRPLAARPGGRRGEGGAHRPVQGATAPPADLGPLRARPATRGSPSSLALETAERCGPAGTTRTEEFGSGGPRRGQRQPRRRAGGRAPGGRKHARSERSGAAPPTRRALRVSQSPAGIRECADARRGPGTLPRRTPARAWVLWGCESGEAPADSIVQTGARV